MTIEIFTFDEIPPLKGRWAITLGTFDGVHRGHQSVLAEVRRAAAAPGVEGSCALTFEPHPREVLSPAGAPALLTSLRERTALLAASGVDRVLVIRFDENLSTMHFADFVRDLLEERLGVDHFVLGHDVHFGRDRGGNAQSVAALGAHRGFTVSQVPSLAIGGQPVSSTRIRRALERGDFELALSFLGHPYLVSGRVVRGRQLGRELGFPTANLQMAPNRLCPAFGVYAGWARWEGEDWAPAITNIGRGPTVALDDPPRVEVHIPDREVELYDLEVEVALGARLREERRFEGLAELRAAIEADLRSMPARIESLPAWARPGRIDDLEADPA